MRLDARDKFPSGMEEYLSYYGWHFSKAMCDWACSKMYKTDAMGKRLYITPWSKDEVDSLLKKYNITLTNKISYDYVFVANMCKADYLGSSVPDGLHLCLYVKDVIDDVDGYDGIAFNRWYADMCRKGIQIDWYNCR